MYDYNIFLMYTRTYLFFLTIAIIMNFNLNFANLLIVIDNVLDSFNFMSLLLVPLRQLLQRIGETRQALYDKCIRLDFATLAMLRFYYYRGLSLIMPFFSFFFFIFSLANLTFPSTLNYVGEMLIFLSQFKILPSIAIFTLVGVLLAGNTSPFIVRYYDTTRREIFMLTPFVLALIMFGLKPQYLLDIWSFIITANFNDSIMILFSPLLFSLKKPSKNNIVSFYWFPLLLHVGEHPDVYDLRSPVFLIPIVLFYIFGILLFLFRAKLLDRIHKLFSKAIKNKLFKKLVINYCLALFYVRGLFEREHKIIIFGMMFPNLVYFINYFVEEISLTSSCWVLVGIWFSTGITLYAIEDLCIWLSKLLREDVKTSIFVNDLSQVINNMDNDILHAGIFTTAGKLSAAGQAAIFSGVATGIIGISTTSINTWYNFKRDQMAFEQAERQRQAEAAQRERDRAYEAWKVRHKAWEKTPFYRKRDKEPIWEEPKK